MDAAHAQEPLPVSPSDILFVPTNGKDGLPAVAKMLRSIRVPVVACADIDILDDRAKVKKLVESLGAKWSNFENNFERATSLLRQPREPIAVTVVLDQLANYLQQITAEEPNRRWDKEVREEVRALTRGGGGPWDDIKKFGVRAFPNAAAIEGVNNLIDSLDEIGLVIVREGVLESFAGTIGIDERKGLGWLKSALEKNVHKTQEAISHVRRFALPLPP
jgi:hypothetical protein